MIIKIDKNGNLHIKRAGKFKETMCPSFGTPGKAVLCGHWCPLFGDITRESINVSTELFNNVILELCQGKVLIVDFVIDERYG